MRILTKQSWNLQMWWYTWKALNAECPSRCWKMITCALQTASSVFKRSFRAIGHVFRPMKQCHLVKMQEPVLRSFAKTCHFSTSLKRLWDMLDRLHIIVVLVWLEEGWTYCPEHKANYLATFLHLCNLRLVYSLWSCWWSTSMCPFAQELVENAWNEQILHIFHTD